MHSSSLILYPEVDNISIMIQNSNLTLDFFFPFHVPKVVFLSAKVISISIGCDMIIFNSTSASPFHFWSWRTKT